MQTKEGQIIKVKADQETRNIAIKIQNTYNSNKQTQVIQKQ